MRRWGYRAGFADAMAQQDARLQSFGAVYERELAAARQRADRLLDHLLSITGVTTLAARSGRVKESTTDFLRNLDADPFEELPLDAETARRLLVDQDAREPD